MTLVKRRSWLVVALLSVSILLIAGRASYRDLQPLPQSLDMSNSPVLKTRLLSRDLETLTITRKNHYNLNDIVPLHDIPPLLQQAFVWAEDQRFYEHAGIDWRARMHALWQNLKSGRIVRGASTISEQVVRILHPRPRTVWSRWLESMEVKRLEQRFSKSEILEFYLNQVPYAAKRRGVAQAARYYFDRSVDTLNAREMLALAVMVRSPSRMNLHKRQQRASGSVNILAQRMAQQGIIDAQQLQEIGQGAFELKQKPAAVDARHFARWLQSTLPAELPAHIQTTLDAQLQARVQQLLSQRLQQLQHRHVNNAAALIVDHLDNEILAWVAVSRASADSGAEINSVLIPRQPGSTLKPFVYALALEKGWTAATLIDDAPLSEMVANGQHQYRNYSRRFYGPLSLREALANSLNIPAVKTLQFVGDTALLQRLQALGMHSLQQHPDVYGDGLALGNGEVSLYELVQAYTVLARQGRFLALKSRLDDFAPRRQQRLFSTEVSSLIADILSDPQARQR
ncbi:MAG: transglycosylase domain-containing protein [gamma proteobacterium symbiont of Bathyaustriella thionipta]|nr:transglycosylase domain-containing protein [gamma proteobacterium symbiont of Bathyaustriella thionipta]